MTGYLRSKGVSVSEERVRRSLQVVQPTYHSQRVITMNRTLNPHPYYAQYFGHKLHFDQNEKLVQFGVTEVAASDGYSGMILGTACMPIKNNMVIYDKVYRSDLSGEYVHYIVETMSISSDIKCKQKMIIIWNQVMINFFAVSRVPVKLCMYNPRGAWVALTQSMDFLPVL